LSRFRRQGEFRQLPGEGGVVVKSTSGESGDALQLAD
jgi:hypothetical protein